MGMFGRAVLNEVNFSLFMSSFSSDSHVLLFEHVKKVQ